MMKKYLIIRCGRCGLPQYVQSDQNTRKCPGCGYHIQVHSANIVQSTEDLAKAQTLVKYLKLPENERNALWDEITGGHKERRNKPASKPG